MFATALICWVLAAITYGALRFTFGPRPVLVNVRWSAAVDDATRHTLEQRYRLTDGEVRGGSTWAYTLLDPSRDNIAALVQDRSVEDTHYIHRLAYRPWRFSPRRSYSVANPAIPVVLEVAVVVLLVIGAVAGALAALPRIALPHVARPRLDQRQTLTAAAVVAFAGTALLRYLALSGFQNEQFEFLAGAQQMLHGEWPSRDFFNPGRPLYYGASAAAQVILGRTLFAEAVLNTVALAAAAVCTLLAAFRLSRSLVVAAAVTVLAVAIFPAPYNYPKVLSTAIAPLVIWAWMDKPTLARMCVLAATVVIAFLFRHDLGVYLGLAALTGIVLTPARNSRDALARVIKFCGIAAFMASPYLVFLAMGDLGQAIRNVTEYGTRHMERTRLNFSTLGWGSRAQLVYGFHGITAVALLWAAIARVMRRRIDAGLILPVIVLAVLVNVQFLRDPLDSRLPDAAVPALLVAAWLVGQLLDITWSPGRVLAIVTAIVFGVVVARTVFIAGATTEHLNRSNITNAGLRGLPALLRTQTDSLRERYSPRHMPARRDASLIPFFDYLDRCTTENHRLLVAGYAAEIFVYSRRLFAAGQYAFIDGYYTSDADQRLMLDRLRSQVVPFAIVLSDQAADWHESQPDVESYVATHYVPMTEIAGDEARTFRILRDARMPVARVDSATRWPCYR